MFRARRIARCRANSLIVFADQLLVAEVLIRRIAPVDFTHALVQIFRERFRQAVGDRFHHDLVVVVMLGFEGVRQRIFFQTTSDRKSTDVIRFTAQFRRNKVRQAVVGETDFFRLLAQVMTHVDDVRTRLVTVNLDVVTHAVSREQAHHAARIQGLLSAEFIQHIIGVFEQTFRLFSHHLIFEDARVFPGQRPGHKERRPVDVVAQRFDAGFNALYAEAVRHRRRVVFPVEGQIVVAGSL